MRKLLSILLVFSIIAGNKVHISALAPPSANTSIEESLRNDMAGTPEQRFRIIWEISHQQHPASRYTVRTGLAKRAVFAVIGAILALSPLNTQILAQQQQTPQTTQVSEENTYHEVSRTEFLEIIDHFVQANKNGAGYTFVHLSLLLQKEADQSGRHIKINKSSLSILRHIRGLEMFPLESMESWEINPKTGHNQTQTQIFSFNLPENSEHIVFKNKNGDVFHIDGKILLAPSANIKLTKTNGPGVIIDEGLSIQLGILESLVLRGNSAKVKNVIVHKTKKSENVVVRLETDKKESEVITKAKPVPLEPVDEKTYNELLRQNSRLLARASSTINRLNLERISKSL